MRKSRIWATFFCIALVLAGVTGCATLIKNKVRSDVDAIWNKGELALVDKIYSDNFVYHSPHEPLKVRNREDYKQLVTKYRTAFPDLHFTVEDIVVGGSKIAVRWVFRGTHQGDLDGIPATGKQVTVTGISIIRIEGTKVVEEIVSSDAMGFLQQLGRIPPKK